MPVRVPEYPVILRAPSSRLWALAWACVFFALFNGLIAFTFGRTGQFRRFHYHTSYEEIVSVVDAVRADPRRKIVFLGGSVMWGDSSPDPEDTIPAAFAGLLGDPDVAVYNLGFIAARPLDTYILALLLRDDRTVFVMDYNYSFGYAVDTGRLIREPETYVRMTQLYSSYAHRLYGDVPEMPVCFDAKGLPVMTLQHPVEKRLQNVFERFLPLLRYKDRVNDMLFGQHPALLLERVGFSLAKGGTVDVRTLLGAPEEIIDSAPWTPAKGPGEVFADEEFGDDALLNCITRAFGEYAKRTALPLIVYVTPNNPAIAGSHLTSPAHERNIRYLLSLFPAGHAHNLDDGTLDAALFTSSTHLTPAGTHVFAAKLLDALRVDLESFGFSVR